MAPESQPAASSAPEFSHALDLLWDRFKPEIAQRVALLESAASAAAAHALTQAQQQTAHSAAHKLAGVLGTFGLAQGTALAREIENLCAQDAPSGFTGADRLLSLASQLRTVVESRAASGTHPK
ncbi:MAG TPA: Hpt domain-containing protein [Terracidiphilus sp.]|nr:Hpt domain-containing protein [Terracidiphilus sp.]